MQPQESPQSIRPPAIRVALSETGGAITNLRFQEPFTIGSEARCDLAIESAMVSSRHAEVVYEDDCWWIRTVEGSRGIFVEGTQVDATPLATGTTVTLGPSGPRLSFIIESQTEQENRSRRKLHLPDPIRKVIRSSTRIISVEEHKAILRRMKGRVEHLQSRRYLRVIGALAAVGIATAGYAYYKQVQFEKLESRAEDFFYQMKVIELDLSRLETQFAASGDTSARAEVVRSRGKLKDLNASYDLYLTELGIYSEGMDEQTRAIYRVARVFGECEVTMPEEFINEVKKYIHEWRRSDRLASSLQRAKERGYTGIITHTMLEQHLPPQFLYLALQESGFDSSLCGPPTRFGIAKGMWQFMPSTAQQYGLRTGPLVEIPRTDPRDDRHRVEKSTDAAARYIRDIYETEAQASGLLVLASYNWGHNLVRGLIRELPENPRGRNFWTFMKTYKSRVPKQTYDYVYYIFSAAVIGENPRVFGFNFDKPVESQMF